MSGDTVVTALAALLAAIVVALWQVGGRGALERRTIKQEIDIASALPVGSERRRLEQQARDRVVLYIHRGSSAGPSRAVLRRLLGATILAPTLAFLSYFVGAAAGRETPWVVGNLVFIAWFGLLGFWASLAIILWLAKNRRREVAEARAAIDASEDV